MTANVCISVVWVAIFRHVTVNILILFLGLIRGVIKIRRKVPPFLYSWFKCDKILKYNRVMHMQLIDIDDAGVDRPRALQSSSRSRDIA